MKEREKKKKKNVKHRNLINSALSKMNLQNAHAYVLGNESVSVFEEYHQ